jgi:hypothetical protein
MNLKPFPLAVGKNNREVEHHIKFSHPFKVKPDIITAFSEIDASCSKDLRLFCFPTEITKYGFTLTVKTWEDTIIYDGTFSWLAINPNNNEISVGNHWFKSNQIEDLRNNKEGHRFAQQTIQFPKSFVDNPQVLTVISAIDIYEQIKDKDTDPRDVRISMEGCNVINSSFDINLSTWNDTKLWSATCSYIAFFVKTKSALKTLNNTVNTTAAPVVQLNAPISLPLPTQSQPLSTNIQPPISKPQEKPQPLTTPPASENEKESSKQGIKTKSSDGTPDTENPKKKKKSLKILLTPNVSFVMMPLLTL